MLSGIDPYILSVIGIYALLGTAALYVLGVMYEGRLGAALYWAGLCLHAGTMALRWAELGHAPLTERHDTLSYAAFVMALSWARLRHSAKHREVEVAMILMIVSFTILALSTRTINSISEFMDSRAFTMHTFFYFASYAALGVSAVAGLGYIWTDDEELEALQADAASVGWVLLSVSVVWGAMWFYQAYGTYWLWTSKELWITATWLWWTTYLHLRLTRGAKGRAASYVGVAGFAVALFTYFGVGTIIPAPPTQF